MATAINKLVLKFILSDWRSWLKCTLVGRLRNDRIATTDSRGRRASSRDPVTRYRYLSNVYSKKYSIDHMNYVRNQAKKLSIRGCGQLKLRASTGLSSLTSVIMIGSSRSVAEI